MSKCKNPQEKKALSLKRDRRNRYGENSKSSRKNIPRGKQRSHQRERRAVIQNLTALSGSAPDVSLMNTAESAVKTAERQLKRRRFKKTADVSLAEAIEDKRFRRTCALEHEAKMRTRIMYIESKALSLNGPARIGRVSFSKRGGTVYYNGRSFQRLKGSGFKANYFDTETSEPYWISGPRTDGEDRLYAGGPPVAIDDDVWDEYWSQIRKKKPPQNDTDNRSLRGGKMVELSGYRPPSPSNLTGAFSRLSFGFLLIERTPRSAAYRSLQILVLARPSNQSSVPARVCDRKAEWFGPTLRVR